ncbi:MAG TPA: saccharopine dehydrogenase [Bacillota bacterium]|nr:saccharopine dehydrogenase [Bacillota bacterium]HQD05281.1 saccharopine dehydrogenase [Bacillota bacterium]
MRWPPGPFYRFEKPIVEACLEAGVNYVSICDDHDAAEAVLKLDPAAREKGLKMVTGLGWTPGITNMLARKGYDELDRVDSIRVYWAGSAGDSTGFAVILHTLHIFSGQVASFQGGRMQEVKAGSEREVVEFPSPLGKVHTFHVGHPEPVTIPLYLEGVKEVTLKGGLAENYLNNISLILRSLRMNDKPWKKTALGKLFKALLPLFPVNRERSLSGARVDLIGYRGRQKVRLSYAVVDHMRRLTGIPLSIGAWMMARGEVKRTGVFGPEAPGGIDADIFLQEIARRKITVERREEYL